MRKSYVNQLSLNVVVNIELGELGDLIEAIEKIEDKGYRETSLISKIKAARREAILEAKREFESLADREA